jgi:hypothetical protein
MSTAVYVGTKARTQSDLQARIFVSYQSSDQYEGKYENIHDMAEAALVATQHSAINLKNWMRSMRKLSLDSEILNFSLPLTCFGKIHSVLIHVRY